MEVAVLVSGSGTNLQAMLDAALPVRLVLADRPCRALEVGQAAGAHVELVDRKQFGGFGAAFDRVAYTERVTRVLQDHRPDLVAMAGFGTVLTDAVHRAFPGRVLNTHPALLPQFPGWHAVEEALAAGVDETGCTVHLASVEVDSGPVLAQARVPVLPGDTVETLHERVKEVERRLYPQTIRSVLDDLAAGRAPRPLRPSTAVPG